jgi:hypothetical protein
LSAGPNFEGIWRSIPERGAEKNQRFRLLTKAELEARERGVLAATASVAGDQPSQEETAAVLDAEALQDTLLRWNDSNHECLLFSNRSHVVNFLSLDPKKLRERMHPGLMRHLQQNHINVGSDLDQLGASLGVILGSLTDVQRTPAEAASLLGGRYCLTGDSLMKMLAIYVRVRCGLPVILMGECGCGKTELIRYLCTSMPSCARLNFQCKSLLFFLLFLSVSYHNFITRYIPHFFFI